MTGPDIRRSIVHNLATQSTECAVIDGGQSHSWEDLGAHVKQLAIEAADADVLIVNGKASFETIAAITYGAVSGKPVIPINPDQPETRIIASAGGLGASPWVDRRLDIARDKIGLGAALEAIGGNVAYVLFTSGSTGRPKGICISWTNISYSLGWASEAFGRGRSEVIGLAAQPFFDIGFFEVLYGLVFGCPIVIFSEPSNSFAVSQTIRDFWVTTIFAVPLFFANLAKVQIDNREIDYPSLRVLISGGDFLSPDTAEAWISRCSVLNVWGPSETSVVNSAWKVRQQDVDEVRAGTIPSIPIGHVSTDMDVRAIRDSSGSDASRLSPGELVVHGPAVGLGYLHQVDRSGYQSEQGRRIFRTGDVGYRDADGRLFILGRSEFMLKIAGHRVDPREVEHWVRLALPCDHAYCVPVAKHGGTVLGLVLLRGDAPDGVTLATLRKRLRGFVPRYMLPKELMVINFLPTNANGKVDRMALANLAKAPM